MCFESLAWATKQELPAMQKIVLVMLADHNSKDGLCFPSYETLAEECGMSKRSVMNQVEKLEAAELLTVERAPNRSNRYTLNALGSERVALGSESLALGSERVAPEPVIKPITKPKDISFSSASEKTEVVLTAEQQDVFDWASVHAYWLTATVSIATFLKVYAHENGAIKAQYDAHKKARETWTASRLNSEKSFNKSTGVHYASNSKSNQHQSTSKFDQSEQRFEQAKERAMAQWRANNAVVVN